MLLLQQRQPSFNKQKSIPMRIITRVQIYLSYCGTGDCTREKQRRMHFIIGTCLISADMELNLCLINKLHSHREWICAPPENPEPSPTWELFKRTV